MANKQQAKKAYRQDKVRAARNRSERRRLKTLNKAAFADAGSDAEAARNTARAYIAALDKAAKHGTIHPNKVNRKKSQVALKLAKA